MIFLEAVYFVGSDRDIMKCEMRMSFDDGCLDAYHSQANVMDVDPTVQ